MLIVETFWKIFFINTEFFFSIQNNTFAHIQRRIFTYCEKSSLDMSKSILWIIVIFYTDEPFQWTGFFFLHISQGVQWCFRQYSGAFSRSLMRVTSKCFIFSISANKSMFTTSLRHFGRAMRKRVFGHMRIAKAQISLRIHAVQSGPSLSANRIIGYYLIYKWRAKTRECACAGWSKSADVQRHFLVWRGLLIVYTDKYTYEGVSINNQPIPFPMDRDGHDFHALFQ